MRRRPLCVVCVFLVEFNFFLEFGNSGIGIGNTRAGFSSFPPLHAPGLIERFHPSFFPPSNFFMHLSVSFSSLRVKKYLMTLALFSFSPYQRFLVFVVYKHPRSFLMPFPSPCLYIGFFFFTIFFMVLQGVRGQRDRSMCMCNHYR